ncbi:GAP family protein [Cellulomonas sp. C5510]|uniref:GAP family protein n=1 Tax=Cellulomonas sp. C5510 TaxID=2871170 RepID=UPI001C98D79C|nr:GAP family protein [Cellulomonas sp. C5510]QZN84402.1 GAP family protein [Cellulomonas sp. C5510]
MLDAIGSFLPVALAVALSPFPLVATTLLLTGPRPRTSGWLFLAGWVVGLGALTAAALLVVGGVESVDGGPRAVAWLRVLLGAVLVVLAVRKVLAARGAGTPGPPGWLSAFDDPAPARTLGLGALLGGANPKNIALAASAAATVQEVAPGAVAASGAVFVLLGSANVLAAVAAHAVAGARAEPALTRVRDLMTRHSAVLTAAVLLLIGGKILGDGLAAL